MQKHVFSLRQAIGFVILVGLLLRLLVFAYIAFEPRKFYTYDSDGYDRRAINLLQYGMLAGEAQPPLTPDLSRTPVYPLFLAAVFGVFGHVPAAAVLLQIVFGSLTGALVVLLVRELELPQWAGVLAGLIVAIDPVSLMTANRLLTETLFTTLLVASVLTLVYFWRRGQVRWLVLSATLFALMALTRPISQVLPIALLPLFVGAARRWKLQRALMYGVLFVVISTALTYSWAYRNYQQAGVFTLSTISDTNLIYYRARAVLAAAQHSSQDEAWQQLQDRITAQATAQHLTPDETLQLQRKEAIGIFVSHPLLTAKMFLSGVGRIFVDPG
ncbi:MAG: glycosyltransferase family 39 protein, partial [Williamsia sp.]|nr:glycosyltransferase family 39 protein [Williamsia sp.]